MSCEIDGVLMRAEAVSADGGEGDSKEFIVTLGNDGANMNIEIRLPDETIWWVRLDKLKSVIKHLETAERRAYTE